MLGLGIESPPKVLVVRPVRSLHVVSLSDLSVLAFPILRSTLHDGQ